MFHFPSAFNSSLVLPPCLRRRSAVSLCSSDSAQSNGVSLSTIENILFETWSKITNKFGFGKVSRKCINVIDVTKTLGGHSGSSGDKSIEDLSKRKGTLENYERKFKESYESTSSQFRTKKLKEIGNEIKTINTTFSKRTRRGRIRKILEKN